MEPSKHPYLSLSAYFKITYPHRIQKITVSLPFSCPHGACDYCLDGSTPPDNDAGIPLEKQIEDGIGKGRVKYGEDTRYMVYFQSYTNTNDSLANLKKYYDTLLKYPEVIGIDVGTRPDAAPDAVLDLLASYLGKLKEVWVEFGLQSAKDETLKSINRGHDAAAFADAVKRAKANGLKVTAHVILGLPGEGREDCLKSAEFCAAAGVDAIKLHPFHVLKGTRIYDKYKAEKFAVLTLEEYVILLADVMETLPPGMVIMRFTAEAAEECLVAPEYCRPEYKGKIKQALIDEFLRRGTKQGSKRV